MVFEHGEEGFIYFTERCRDRHKRPRRKHIDHYIKYSFYDRDHFVLVIDIFTDSSKYQMVRVFTDSKCEDYEDHFYKVYFKFNRLEIITEIKREIIGVIVELF